MSTVYFSVQDGDSEADAGVLHRLADVAKELVGQETNLIIVAGWQRGTACSARHFRRHKNRSVRLRRHARRLLDRRNVSATVKVN